MQTMKIAGERNGFARSFGAPNIYQPTLPEKAIAKAVAFCASLLKQLSFVFISIVLEMGAKKAKAKTSEKLRGVLGEKERDDTTEYNRNKLYGNRYDDYSKYDNMSNRQYDQSIPFNKMYN